MLKSHKNLGERGAAPILILIAVVGILAYVAVSSSASFKDSLFSILYPKPESQAAYLPPGSVRFVDSSGRVIYTTTSAAVKVQYTNPNWNTGKKPSVSGPVTVTTKNIVLAEDRRFRVNVKTVGFGTSGPIDYTFSNSRLGRKSLYVKFIASNNREQNASPFPTSIRLVKPPVSAPIPSPSPTPSPPPTPRPTVTPTASPTPSPTPNPVSDLSVTINPSTVPTSVTVATTEKTKLFDVTSTGAIQITAGVSLDSGAYNGTLFANPYSPVAMTRGQTVPIYIAGGNFAKAGVYPAHFAISTITQANPTVKTLSFPLTVTVVYANKSSRVFVTSRDFKGDLYPYNGNGDNLCTGLASTAGLGGVWQAWLSSTNDRVGGPAQSFIKYSGPYKTINGTVNGGIVANNWDDLVDGGLQWRIDRDEFGRDRAGANVWTGTDPTGNLVTAPYTANCNNWSSVSSQALGWNGNSAYANREWTLGAWISPSAGSASSCDTLRALYCFEELPITP